MKQKTGEEKKKRYQTKSTLNSVGKRNWPNIPNIPQGSNQEIYALGNFSWDKEREGPSLGLHSISVGM